MARLHSKQLIKVKSYKAIKNNFVGQLYKYDKVISTNCRLIVKEVINIMNKTLLEFKIDYELYKRRWVEDHIDRKVAHDTNKLYKSYCLTEDAFINFEEYIEKCGYSTGEMYVCFDSFVSNEYINHKNKSTIKRNLKEVKKDLKKKEKAYRKTTEDSMGDLTLYREINDLKIVLDRLREILDEFNDSEY